MHTNRIQRDKLDLNNKLIRINTVLFVYLIKRRIVWTCHNGSKSMAETLRRHISTNQSSKHGKGETSAATWKKSMRWEMHSKCYAGGKWAESCRKCLPLISKSTNQRIATINQRRLSDSTRNDTKVGVETHMGTANDVQPQLATVTTQTHVGECHWKPNTHQPNKYSTMSVI